MKHLKLFILPAIFFLTELNSFAQKIKTLNGTVHYESGMSETTFETSNGAVIIGLPQSMSGAMINGTVSTEPAGKTEKEKNRNLKELLKMVVNLGGQRIPLSVSPSNFDWITNSAGPGRTALELLNIKGDKLGEASLPPVLSAPALANPGASPRLSTPSNVLVKGDVLNIYTDQQFSSGEKFILTNSRGQQLILKPICLSTQQAVIKMPEDAFIGDRTITAEVWNQPITGYDITKAAKTETDLSKTGLTGTVKFNLIDITLTSPNTNLRPGQESFVLTSIVWDNRFTGEFDYYNIDLRNLNPNTVTMEGGNLQRVNVSAMIIEPDNDELLPRRRTIRRNITGNAVGTFSVSATLHEDYTTSNDPFRPQLNVLKTPEDFNAWANALKKDLKEYASVQNNDAMGQAVKTNAQRAIDNMPVCTSPEQLDESKAVAYSLVQPLHVPKGTAINWLSSYEASKAAAKAIDNTLAGNTELIDYDVLKNGTEFINRVGGQLKDASLQTQCSNVQKMIDDIQTSAETKENLQQLKNNVDALLSAANTKMGPDVYSYFKPVLKDLMVSSCQLPSLARPGEVHPFYDLIGFMDPQKEVLMAVPEYQQKVLNQYNAVKQPDGKYLLQTNDTYGKPVSMTASFMVKSQLDIFLDANEDEETLEEYISGLNTRARNDTSRAAFFIKREGVFGFWSRIFKNAICQEVDPASDSPCQADKLHEGGFIIFHYAAEKHCKKGLVECKERLILLMSAHLYTEAGCKGKKTLSMRVVKWPYFSCD